MSKPRYDHREIEPRWQERWQQDGLYDSDIDPDRKKLYCLTMLPYPSGDLHIGHWYAITPSDARARFKRRQGFNVLFPIGFDSFGLPAENAAIKRNTHPREWTDRNIERMRTQLRSMGAMFDWRREIVSSHPEYYRWSQWFFLKLWENDLAYRKRAAVDFCPTCNTTLAREQVWGDDRHCERCETPVVKRELEQWFFRITRYADELLAFEAIDWPERVKLLQTNWIGRSEGAHVVFRTEAGETLEVFTTRPDTLWGATFMVLAPEHPLLETLVTDEQRVAVTDYISEAVRQTEIQREATDKEKTGVFTGGYAVNPVNGERIPVWVADYVLMTYGTGAIMAVPAHDERDFAFATRYGLEIRPVISSPGVDESTVLEAATSERGPMMNSGDLSGTPADEAVARTVERLEREGIGRGAVNFRIRDWLISRQRYWGTPIPAIHCPKCGIVPVPEEDLPVVLPDDIEWRPTGESPLLYHETWRRVACPTCGGDAQRETDTMDTFMCSNWYFYRYLSPHFDEGPWDPEQLAYWMPVDIYTGGIEHATMHLIYTRFFTKALRDMGLASFDEPMLQLRNQGIIIGEDSEKMSKSRGNVASPDELVERYGADTVRAYLMFFARWEQGAPWSSTGIEGVYRWLYRVFGLVVPDDEPTPAEAADPKAQRDLRRKAHQSIQAVTRNLEDFQFNTIVSTLMELTNTLVQARGAGLAATTEFEEARDILVQLSSPVAPHLAEELWARLGHETSIHDHPWPDADDEAAAEEEITLVVQINGKVRDKIGAPADIDEASARELALASDAVRQHLGDREPRKVIYVPGRLVNIVG